MISVDEAWERIRARAQPLLPESRPLARAAGLCLAEAISSPLDLPPFDSSAMDGYALRAEDTRAATDECPVKLPVTGEVAAGDWREIPVSPQTAVEIMTGAALPPGTDCVLQLEAGRFRKGIVEIRAPVSEGRHIRRRGEDVRRGDGLLEAGVRLNAQRLGLLSHSGIAEVFVHRPARVSLLATGSELVPAGAPLKPGQIYDSNRSVLERLIHLTGSLCDNLGVVPDDPAAIRERLCAALAADVILLSGGVSVGAHDHVKSVLEQMGMERLFWRVQMKPGKPLLCGRLGETWIFGLPGNPISCVVGFLVFIEPLLRILHGERKLESYKVRARLTREVRKKDARRTFMTATLSRTAEGSLAVTPTAKQGSAMMQALAQADAFLIVPEECASIAAGEWVDVLPFTG